MLKLEKIIKEVKDVRVGNNRPIIYNENGELRSDILLVDILNLLYELIPYEIDSECVKHLSEEDEILYDNTYNYKFNVSNDLDYAVLYDTMQDKYIAKIRVHLLGDIRATYSDEFYIEIGDSDSLLDWLIDNISLESLCSIFDTEINKIAEVYMFSKCVIVDGNEYYVIELQELNTQLLEEWY